MKQNFTLLFINLFVGAFLFSSSILFAQIEIPETDHVPLDYIRYIHSYQSDFPDAVVTDAGGYDNFNLGVAFAEPHLVQNPNNPLQYFTSWNTNTAYRTNDAFTWTISSPPFSASTYGDPVNAYDSLGNLYYENMSGSGTIENSRVIRSTNNGQTWGTSVIAVLGGDKNWMAADQTSGPYAGYLYTTMTATSFTAVNFNRSTDHGASFTQTKTFTPSTPLPGSMVCVGPNVVGGDIPGGCVYVVTNSGSATASTYTFHLSTDGGLTFTQKSVQNFSNYVGTLVNSRNSVQNMRTRPYPFITADNSFGPHRGRLYLVYASNTPAGNGNKPDIFCRYSDDQAVTWSSAVVINDDANTTANNQWHPSIWCDKTTGRLFAKWMDTRDTPTSDSAHIYASYSDDGVTFAPNQRLTTSKMKINCTTCGGGGTPMYLGDYDAITSLNNQALACWTDFRAGSFGSYVGFFPDYALTVSSPVDTIGNENDSIDVNINVPSVKLYDSEVLFSATITPVPSTGTLIVEFPNGNSLSTFPGTMVARIKANGMVPVGNYTLNIVTNGPNGTPVHKRTSTIVIGLQIPVELTAFAASVQKNEVVLNWTTATETNNLGFDIQRKSSNGKFETIGFVSGNGTTTEINHYNFVDRKVDAGNYSYRLLQRDFNGTFEYSPEVNVSVELPMTYALEQNYPNPFNPTTTIGYSIPVENFVTIKLYDVLGNEVITLLNEQKQAGKYEILYNASNLASGVYYYQIKAGEFTMTRKLMLMK